MIDYNDSEVMWWMHEIAYMVRVMQSSWKKVTHQSVAMELHNFHDLPDTTPSDELLEMCEEYFQRYSDPFLGLGDTKIDLRVLTNQGRNALFSAVTARSKLLKAHAAELDAYIMANFENEG